MAQSREYLLVIEPDPRICEVVGRQSLQAAGYRVECVSEVSAAIAMAVQTLPDVILCDLVLEGLSSKDLLVALRAQGLDIPVVLIAPKGAEADLIQNFRVGAVDYLLWPAREPEVLTVVERVLKQVRERRAREQLAQALQHTNQELQQRLDELNTIFNIAKVLTSLTHQGVLLEQLLEQLIKVTRSDLGWVLLKDEERKGWVLVAGKHLPASLMAQRNHPWEDGLSGLVALSGESLALNGEPLKRFRVTTLGRAALIVPIKASQQVIGIVVLMRKQDVPYSPSQQRLVEAVADFASISLANARLFRALEERVRVQQALMKSAGLRARVMNQTLQQVCLKVREHAEAQNQALEQLTKDPTARWSPMQRQALTAWRESLEGLYLLAGLIPAHPEAAPVTSAQPKDLNGLVSEAVRHLRPLAQHRHQELTLTYSPQPLLVEEDETLLRYLLHGLLALVMGISEDGQIRGCTHSQDDAAHLELECWADLDDEQRKALQKQPFEGIASVRRRFPGEPEADWGLIRQILNQCRGKIWLEFVTPEQLRWHLTLPLVQTQATTLSSLAKATETP
ncbi:GAF domain-containing protein [uncultured Thermanaerothrix sp.]|uniref:GAF domain-containing protein n=1 Tax=uncultured Thermanaerothrix sp. TaxID=1195149 RepID=UPI0026286A4D|nr:GAF domain-containing protein [uncultured Thermanaerothrix sp.]